VPSPADAKEPEFTAREILTRIRRGGGKVFRMRERLVFTIVTDAELAQWLLDLGGVPYLPRGMTPSYEHPAGAYRDSPSGPWKFDIYINGIACRGEKTIWELAEPRAELYVVGESEQP